MFLIKTEVKASSIHGMGLFAAQSVKKGQIIWEWKPYSQVTFSLAAYNRMRKIEKSFLETYGFVFEDEWIVPLDNGRFVNHSFTPNIEYLEIFKNGAVKYVYVATRALKIGDEITENYKGGKYPGLGNVGCAAFLENGNA